MLRVSPRHRCGYSKSTKYPEVADFNDQAQLGNEEYSSSGTAVSQESYLPQREPHASYTQKPAPKRLGPSGREEHGRFFVAREPGLHLVYGFKPGFSPGGWHPSGPGDPARHPSPTCSPSSRRHSRLAGCLRSIAESERCAFSKSAKVVYLQVKIAEDSQ